VDLGAGDGRIIIYAGEKYHIHSIGLEINLELIKYGNNEIKIRNIGDICNIIEADFYDFNISNMDIIFCFLIPTFLKYFLHVIKKIKSNSVIISIRYPLNEFSKYWKKSYIIKAPDNLIAFIYIKK